MLRLFYELKAYSYEISVKFRVILSDSVLFTMLSSLQNTPSTLFESIHQTELFDGETLQQNENSEQTTNDDKTSPL